MVVGYVRRVAFCFFVVLMLSLFIFHVLSYFKAFSNSYLRAGPTEVNLLALWENKEYKEIIDYAENGLKANKFDFNLNLLLGFSYFYYSLMLNDSSLRTRFLDNSIERLRFLMSINDDIPMSSLYYILGKAYSHKGEYYSELSVKYLNKALHLNSFDFMSIKEDIFEYLGYSYQLLKDYKSSLTFFTRAYKENKSDLVLWNLAYINYKIGNIDKSVEYINKFVKGEDESFRNEKNDDNLMQKVYLLYGDIYLDQGAYGMAFSCYDKVLKINRLNPNVYVRMGDIYRRRDRDYPKARKYWREALSINPYLEEARERLGIGLEDF
ncbi:hypothetical protein LKV13_03645 [Borrelia sp. BU AG58]|uniref:tetratricopeptide repeat protein n=1 Tax=Borrelia sp. BU AG58 TaxID=2887345 RepID=UPI001E2ECB0E|nr:hypothetical protein [Borrelia sp. BU AG58]UER67859.1 hypothetical protein LKV13_03645 [Borrelia sp. BU AG58]